MMEIHQSVCMSEYQYQTNLIYKGHHSSVYKAINKKRQQQPFLFKAYSQSYLGDPIKQKKLNYQLNILWKLSGKDNIVQVVSQHSRDQKVFVITEFYELGTLAQEIKKEGKFTQEKSIAYIQQIIKGYSHIYQAQIIHRNLQPSNILCAGLQLKIGDFSDSIGISDIRLSAMHQQLVGNIHYQPFETLSDYRYSTKSDIYSIGAILFCMLKGRPPFQGASKTEIIAKMKKSNIKDLLKDVSNRMIKEFLQTSLQMNEQKRMGIQELLAFKFNSMPQLHRLKLYTFDDRSDQLVQQPIRSYFEKRTSFDPKKDQVQKQKQKLENSSKLLFKRFEPSQKKVSMIDLKVSDECELSKLYRDKQISIFIPTKFDLNNSIPLQHQQSQLISQFHIDCIEPIENRPSEAFMTKKNVLGESLRGKAYGEDKNKTIKELMDNMKQGKKQPNLILSKKQLSNLKSTNIAVNNNTIEFDRVIVPPLQFRNEKQTNSCSPNQIRQNKNNALDSKRTTQRSKGLFTLRGRENFTQQNGETKNTLIGGWLVSQIDMFRFINRVLFRIKKVDKDQLQKLYSSLDKLKILILSDVKNLALLSRYQRESFEQSAECDKIRQIVAAYESKCVVSVVQFQGFQGLNKVIVGSINWLYKELLGMTALRQDWIKLLDYLITLWQLMKLLKKNNLQYFHSKSKIQDILDSKETKLTIAHLLQLYERMRTLRLI